MAVLGAGLAVAARSSASAQCGFGWGGPGAFGFAGYGGCGGYGYGGLYGAGYGSYGGWGGAMGTAAVMRATTCISMEVML